jgi:hypothetical protein
MANLLHNTDYFARYGQHLADAETSREAWEKTERDFFRETGGFRRFTTYESFAAAFSSFRAGNLNGNINLKCVVKTLNGFL